MKKLLLLVVSIVGVLFESCSRGSFVENVVRVKEPFVLEEIKSHSVYNEYYFYTKGRIPKLIIVEGVTGKFSMGDTLLFTSKTDTIGSKK